MKPENDHNLAITEETDPKLDAMLDAALAPEPAPQHLNERIVAATAPDLPVERNRIASLGLLRFAAVLAMAIGLGVVLWSASEQTNRPADGGVATADTTPTLEELEARLDRLAAVSDAAAADTGWLDDQIDMLDLRFEMLQADEAWPDEQEMIAAIGARYELDRMVDEMSLMF